MSGAHSADPEMISLTVALADGSKVHVVGEHDGVNGFDWRATHDDEQVEITVDSNLDGEAHDRNWYRDKALERYSGEASRSTTTPRSPWATTRACGSLRGCGWLTNKRPAATNHAPRALADPNRPRRPRVGRAPATAAASCSPDSPKANSGRTPPG